MRDKKYAGIIAGLFVVAITGFTIWGTDFLKAKNSSTEVAIEVNGAEGVKEAAKLEDKDGNVTGYAVVTTTKGFHGDVELKLTFDADGKTLSGMEVVAQTETEGLGAKVAEPEYLAKFSGVATPVQLAGSNGTGTEVEAISGATITSTAVTTSINNASNFIQSNK